MTPPIHGRILRSVRYPEIVNAGTPQLPAHESRDPPASLDMLLPEIANPPVLAAQSEARIRLRMGKACRVEVQIKVLSPRPIDPSSKMLRIDFIAVDFRAAEFSVHRMKIQTMMSRDERIRFL